MKGLLIKIKNFFQGDARTALLKKNLIGSLCLKLVSIVVSLLVVPMTIDFVNPTQYGIWITISSLMAWVFFFDIGFTQGFRNRFAEAKAKGKIKLARIYLSTTYATLFILFSVVFAIAVIFGRHLNWSSILRLDEIYQTELSNVFLIMVASFCLTIVLQVFTTMTTADQRPVIAAAINVIGQIAALIALTIILQFSQQGSLIDLAFIFSGTPICVLLFASIIFFITKYRKYMPSYKLIRWRCIKDIMGMGLKFFLITASMLLIFQLMTVIITRELGPDVATKYNVSFKYFNVAYMLISLIINPFWSAFTDAYVTGNYDWMKIKIHQLERLWLLLLPILGIMFVIAPYVIDIWIKEAVQIEWQIHLSVVLYIAILSLSAIYMYCMNGIGKIQIQLLIYLSFACVAFPIMSFFCRMWGIPGLLIVPSVVYLIQAFFGRLQIHKILNNEAFGIWNK